MTKDDSLASLSEAAGNPNSIYINYCTYIINYYNYVITITFTAHKNIHIDQKLEQKGPFMFHILSAWSDKVP